MPSDPPPVDLARTAALRALLGTDRMMALLDILSARLDAIAAAVSALPFARADVAAIVHQSQGSAGSLGLTKVMHLLQRLEETIASNDPRGEAERTQAAALVLTARQARELLEQERLVPSSAAGPTSAAGHQIGRTRPHPNRVAP